MWRRVVPPGSVLGLARLLQLDRIAALTLEFPATLLASRARRCRPEDVHFHDLRHTGNQLTANAGANLKELMAQMKHDSERDVRPRSLAWKGSGLWNRRPLRRVMVTLDR